MENHGLTIVLMLMFAGSIAGHFLAGWHVQNEELARHGEPAISLSQFATDPLFLSTVFENWESEFLQMATYVLLTACLVQRGSAESNAPANHPGTRIWLPKEKGGTHRRCSAGAGRRGSFMQTRWGSR